MADFDKIDHKSCKIRGLKTVSSDVHNTKHYDVKYKHISNVSQFFGGPLL